MPIKTLFKNPSPASGISVMIPSRDGDRCGNVAKIIESLKSQTVLPDEILIIIAEKPNGHARNVGARQAKGEFFVFIDDDATLIGNEILANLISCFKNDVGVGMAGSSTKIPPCSNAFQRWFDEKADHASYEVVSEMTDTKHGATHLCVAFPRAIYEELDGESDILVTGTDLDMRHRIREAGYRVVLAPNCLGYHPPPASMEAFLKSYFWYGQGTPVFERECPEHFGGQAVASIPGLFLTILIRLIKSFLIFFINPGKKVWLCWRPFFGLQYFCMTLGYLNGYFKYISSGKYKQVKEHYDKKPYLENGEDVKGWG